MKKKGGGAAASAAATTPTTTTTYTSSLLEESRTTPMAVAHVTAVRYTRNLFLRSMCIIYLFAFLSFYVQIPGLYGDNGVLPAKTQLDLQSREPLLQKLKQKPTLLWFAPYIGLNVEYMLDVLALSGVLISFLGFVSQKICSAPVFMILWSLYYSIYQIGQTFMWFQWDVLLLEAGFLSIVVAPFWYSNNTRKGTQSDQITFWLVRWLFFRLTFSSGAVKLISECPVWWNLDALSYYFQSQCLPTPLAWYAHHLPDWFLRLNTVFANVSELAVPFLFFFPVRKVRLVAFYLHLFLQTHIIATGNYNFLNLLTICLSLSLLDDEFFYRKKPKTENAKILSYISTFTCTVVYGVVLYGTYVLYNLKFTDKFTITSKIGFTQEQFDYVLIRAVPYSFVMGIASLAIIVTNSTANALMYIRDPTKKLKAFAVTMAYIAIAVVYFSVSAVPYSNSLIPQINETLPKDLKLVYSKVEPFHIANGYGLFRKMTGIEGRQEVIIEGSNSIEGPWKEYQFLYKPGNVNNSLPFVAPHQPRLDWQMWFAAFGTYHQNPWLMSLAYRILNGQPEVLALLNGVDMPFKNSPPKYVRASLYLYHYTPWNNERSGQAWWTRERKSEYFPIFSKDHPPLIEYLQKMKIIQNKPSPKVTNTTFKAGLDFLRSIVVKFEPTLLLWGMFTAGCAIIMTG